MWAWRLVDAVQERTGDAVDPGRVRLVAADHGMGTGALVYLVTVPAAGAGIVTKQLFSLSLR
jgi:hypothetical protein